MKFKCNSKYIPNVTAPITEYKIINQDTGMLNYFLEDTSKIINELFYQYPDCLEDERIEELIEYQYQKAKILGVNPEFCYHYNGRSRGIIIRESMDQDIIPIKLTTTEYIKGAPNYQRRVDLIYTKEDDSFILTNLIELEKHNEIIIQKNTSPNVLKKKRKYINY